VLKLGGHALDFVGGKYLLLITKDRVKFRVP
jgi:hypothetical protein